MVTKTGLAFFGAYSLVLVRTFYFAKRRSAMTKRIIFPALGILCLLCAVCFIWCSASVEFAEEHYQNHYEENEDGIYIFSEQRYEKGYGCGEDDCSYCNGGKGKTSVQDFAYYRAFSSGRIASGIGAGLFAISIVTAVAYQYSKRKSA